jgi:predicted nucleic acid-binding protein
VPIKERAIVDTGYIVALFYDKDDHNQHAVDWENRFGDDYELVTTPFIVQEIYQLLLARVGVHAGREFIKCVSEGFIQVVSLPENWSQKVEAVLKRFSDKELDFADISIVLLADQLNLGAVLTVDRKDFEFLRWGDGKKTFDNLLYTP